MAIALMQKGYLSNVFAADAAHCDACQQGKRKKNMGVMYNLVGSGANRQ